MFTEGKGYWGGTGKYQHLYETYFELLVPQAGESTTEHGELLRNFTNVYYDFHNNGNDTWYAVVSNFRISPSYKAPKDAPRPVREFFNNIKEECQEWIRQRRIHEDFDPCVHYFSNEELESIADMVVLYVHGKQAQ